MSFTEDVSQANVFLRCIERLLLTDKNTVAFICWKN